jgi:hypothetical protein
MAGAFDLAERLGLQPVATVGDEPTVANPIGLSRTPVSYRSAPPRLGDATLSDDGVLLAASRVDATTTEVDQ